MGNEQMVGALFDAREICFRASLSFLGARIEA
jgi:hypothetical protein